MLALALALLAASSLAVLAPPVGATEGREEVPSARAPANAGEPRPEAGEARCVDKASWTGLIVDADTDEGVPDAEVELHPRGQTDALRVRTDADGRVHVDGLCTGTLHVSVRVGEHEADERTVDLVAPGVDTTIYLAPLHAHHSERVIVVHDDDEHYMGASEEIAGAELAQTRGVGLSDAIEQVSGVSTLRGPAGGMGKPVIRGQIGRRNLIIFDGIRHEGQKWGLDHAPEVDPYAAGRLTVIKGAATTRFGPDAIGGVVLVEPRPLPRAPGVAGEVSTVGGSNPLGGGLAARFDHAPARLPGFAWRVEGNVGRHRAALTPDYPLDNTGDLSWNVGARAGYLGDRFDLTAGYRLLRTRAGICTCLRVSTPEEFDAAVSARQPVASELYTAEFPIERPLQAYWHHLAMARTRVDLGAGGELHATYAYQFNDREEYDIVRSNIDGPQLTFQLATHSVDLDYEHPRVELGRDWVLVGDVGASFSHQQNAFTAATTLIPDYRQAYGGVYVVERFVAERVELELGARYDGLDRRASLNERDYLGQLAGERLDADACERTDDDGALCRKVFHTPSASAGVLTRPFARVPELSWRVDLNSSARIPAIDEQFMNGAAPSFPILGLGDSRIGVERTWGGATNLVYAGTWLYVEGSAYANYIDDYIYFKPEPQEGQCAPLTCTTRGPLPVFVFEPTDALFGGGELSFELDAPRLPLSLSGDAAWVRAIDLETGGYLALIPADRYRVAGRWNWADFSVTSNGFLEIDGTYVARQRRYDPDADFADPPKDYVLLGASVGVEFPGQDYLVRTSLTGANLLNARYREYTSLLRYFADEPGWSLTLRVAVEFSVGT
ncbi:TonB-dependent receptor [Pseudenhygromyxa sp. WMMC2535]|uniref:TonB-dependent receptor n=1 Tax=Pseudenhygromyxa sp. WMMC2535 TaxID=2712867 RepID=UPI00155673D9|nr:TonB-dependent receptor [Pseudenhygromyxa sp. WMMC2535]NVB38847.1 TonB-dependent receptor [Pseudenhygromyxa sp. WMMC2535]